jgi:hypothetical protein
MTLLRMPPMTIPMPKLTTTVLKPLRRPKLLRDSSKPKPPPKKHTRRPMTPSMVKKEPAPLSENTKPKDQVISEPSSV